MLQSQEAINNVFWTCCILHNILLEFDGYDKRWEEDVNWENLDPQPTNSDDNYDADGMPMNHDDNGETSTQGNRRRILEHRSMTTRLTEAEEEELGHNIDIQVDNSFDSKRKALINHFHLAYNRNEVNWPKGMSPIERMRLAQWADDDETF